MSNEKILVGEKHSPIHSVLYDFECISPKQWAKVKNELQIPDGFLFLAGSVRYKKSYNALLRFGKDHLFVQSFLPHKSDKGVYRTRGFGRIYSLYEPASKGYDDDMMLEETAIYQSLPDNKIKLVLGIGEHLKVQCVKSMFDAIRTQRDLYDFAPENSLPRLYTVTFKNASCGYFLKGNAYKVWATPVGLPDQQTGEIVKGWIFCDINCGIPAIIRAERENFFPMQVANGTCVGLYIFRDGQLVYEP